VYVETLAEKVGLEVVVVEDIVGRMDKGEPIKGFLFVMVRK
jgi:predicted TPR repeat methyltransferase